MKNYEEGTPSKYIMYLDADNLYGWAKEDSQTRSCKIY